MIQIDFEYFKKAKLHLNSFDAILLFLIYSKETKEALLWCNHEMDVLFDTIQRFQSQGLIKIVGSAIEDIEFRSKYLDLLPTESKQSTTVEEWINDWRELWPSGVKSGGYYLKSNKEDLLNKMSKFVKKYKFTKDQIFEATKNYLTEQKSKGWTYTKLANYFIDKDNISILASYCSNIGSKVEGKKDYGELV